MTILKTIIGIVVLIGILMLIYNITTFHWPRGWKANIYYKKEFSYEMCNIVGAKNRGEITEEEEFKALEKEYLADKAVIDLNELIHSNGLNHGSKWGIGYSAMYSQDQNQTPIPIMEYWTEEFIQFSLQKIKEGAKPGFIATFYDKNLRKFF